MATQQLLTSTIGSLAFDLSKGSPIVPEKYQLLLAKNPAPFVQVWPAEGSVRQSDRGIDILATGEMLVRAVLQATVASVDIDRGKVVLQYDQDPDWTIEYSVLSSVRVKPSQSVRPGDVIASISPDEHNQSRLRFSVHLRPDYNLPPLVYLPLRSQASPAGH